MTLRQFSNALRVVLNLERVELVRAGLMRQGDHEAWSVFRRDPLRWLIRADDQKAEILWRLVEQRMG